MGAVAVTDLYKKRRLSVTEGEFLLSFCNNIGPVYFISFALPSMGNPPLLPCLFGMYGIPLLYGIVLRHTRYRCKLSASARKTPVLCQASYEKEASLLAALDESVTASLHSITKLGGYMILFQILNVYPSLFLKQGLYPGIAQGLLEISGGLALLQDTSPCLYSAVSAVLPRQGASLQEVRFLLSVILRTGSVLPFFVPFITSFSFL